MLQPLDNTTITLEPTDPSSKISPNFQNRLLHWFSTTFNPMTRPNLMLAVPVAGSIAFLFLLENCLAATPASPQLNRILPRGVQRGTEHVLTFAGARLQGAEEIFLYDSGIQVKNIEEVDGNTLKVTVAVADDCRLGEHLAQVRTRSGVSEFRSFFVGALPAIQEVEPNNEFNKPQRIEWNHTVAGVCTNEDVDYYIISCQQGQRLSIEIEGMRLGTAFFDPFIAILDKDRFEIAVSDDTTLTGQDGFISVIVPQAGDYTIVVRETAYRGNGDCHYRLHVGDFPRPAVAYPAGGQIGETVPVTFLGDASGEIVNEVPVTAPPRRPYGLTVQDEQGVSPSPINFRRSPVPNTLEAEPNDNFDSATPAQLPTALNGIIHEPGQEDWFKFTAQKGTTWEFECYARRVHSQLDAVINLFGPDKKHIVGNDDRRGLDPQIRWQCPADGEYFLRVRDQRSGGGADFVYRVEVNAPTPKLTVGIPRVSRYSQYRQSIFVPQGGRFATQFTVSRVDFNGPVQLDASGLPEGVSMVGGPTVGNLNSMPIVFEAADDAPLGGTLLELDALHSEKPQITGHYLNQADFVNGPPNNAAYTQGTTTKLPVVVVERLPFQLEIVEPKAPLVRDGQLQLKVIAQRDEGFNQPIRLEFPFRPPGVGTSASITIPADQQEIEYPLNANANAQLGKWPIFVIGSADVGGQAWTSSQLATLEIAERFVTMEMSPASAEQGQTTQIVCKLNQLNSFEGAATAELVGLPPEATADPLQLTAESTEVIFEVATSDKTPPGQHKGLFCRVTITQQNEPVVAVAGRGVLQVDKPLPDTQPQPQTTKSNASEKPKEKPMTRLEKLREQARLQREAMLKKSNDSKNYP